MRTFRLLTFRSDKFFVKIKACSVIFYDNFLKLLSFFECGLFEDLNYFLFKLATLERDEVRLDGRSDATNLRFFSSPEVNPIKRNFVVEIKTTFAKKII